MESLRRKLGSSKTWENIPRVPVVAIKHHLSQTYAGIQYGILLPSQRLHEIICVLASHASLLNIRISSSCSLLVAMDWTQYVNFMTYFPDTAQDLNSMDFLFLFLPCCFLLTQSIVEMVCFFNKTFFRCQVSLQLQQEQYPNVLSFPFGSNSLWVPIERCFAEEKKDNNEWLKIPLLRKIWTWFQFQRELTFFLAHSLTLIEDQQDLVWLQQRPPMFKVSGSLKEVP